MMDVQQTVALLSAQDLERMAALVGVAATREAVARVCQRDSAARETLRGPLFDCPARSQTPPRQTIRPMLTPPSVNRVRKAQEKAVLAGVYRRLHF